jgi:hypothetical protein
LGDHLDGNRGDEVWLSIPTISKGVDLAPSRVRECLQQGRENVGLCILTGDARTSPKAARVNHYRLPTLQALRRVSGALNEAQCAGSAAHQNGTETDQCAGNPALSYNTAPSRSNPADMARTAGGAAPSKGPQPITPEFDFMMRYFAGEIEPVSPDLQSQASTRTVEGSTWVRIPDGSHLREKIDAA